MSEVGIEMERQERKRDVTSGQNNRDGREASRPGSGWGPGSHQTLRTVGFRCSSRITSPRLLPRVPKFANSGAQNIFWKIRICFQTTCEDLCSPPSSFIRPGDRCDFFFYFFGGLGGHLWFSAAKANKVVFFQNKKETL